MNVVVPFDPSLQLMSKRLKLVGQAPAKYETDVVRGEGDEAGKQTRQPEDAFVIEVKFNFLFSRRGLGWARNRL